MNTAPHPYVGEMLHDGIIIGAPELCCRGGEMLLIQNRRIKWDLIVAREPIQQRKVDQIPHPRLLPVAQATPARHPRPASEFRREHLPGNAAAEDEDDAGETRTVRNARPSALRPTW
jgi:hypothetical protein